MEKAREIKNKKDDIISELNKQIKDKNIQLINEQNDFNEKSALKDQEINFINEQYYC